MLAQIDAQRAEAYANQEAGLPAGHWICGHAIEIRVSVSGVTTRVVRKWGDAVRADRAYAALWRSLCGAGAAGRSGSTSASVVLNHCQTCAAVSVSSYV